MFLTWIIIGILLLIVEVITVSFLYVFFAIGCIVAGILTFIIPSLAIQIVIMCMISMIGVLFGRDILQKYFKVNKEVKPSTIDALIGKNALVVKDIKANELGLVKINGEIWSAKSPDSKEINKGTNVIVEKIDGAKLIVKIV